MSKTHQPVREYMTSPVHTVSPSDDLHSVYEQLVGLGISSVPVVEDDSHIVGVISMTDLLKVGRHRAADDGEASLIELPTAQAYEHMSAVVVTISPEESVAQAARRMVEGHYHRVYVMDGMKLAGVISTRDVMAAVCDKELKSPIKDWMSSPAFTVRADQTVSDATDRLRRAHITGLIVVEDGWPVGVYAQREALEAGGFSRETRVDAVMNAAMLVLDESTRLHRAAAQAAALRVRRVIAMRNREVVGIMTGFDFARAVM